MAAPILGGRLYGTGGNVVVEVLPPTASFTSELHLVSPGPDRFIALNHDVGTIVNLGSFPAGVELIFSCYVRNTGQTFFTGPASRNPDGILHAALNVIGAGVANVGFEDLFGGGDRDYDDNNFQFRGGISTFGCPDNMVVASDAGQCSAVVNYTVPVGNTSVACDPPPGTVFPKGVTIVNCTAVDAFGNRQNCSFSILVVDREAPVITCPANQIVSNALGQCSATVNPGTPTVTDNCDGNSTPGGFGTLYFTTFAGGANVHRVNFHYDGVAFSLGAPITVASTVGADGVIFAPDGDLLVGGQGDRIHKVVPGTGATTTRNVGGTASFHLSLDPSGLKAWSASIPGALAEVPLNPFANGIPRPLVGDDTSITSIAFDASGNAYYTTAASGGFGSVGRINLTTFTTTRVLSGIPAAHGMVFDPFTGHLMLFGSTHVTQINPVNFAILSDRSFPGASFDQGTADGTGHLYVADNGGRLLFLDYSATGLIGDAGNFSSLQPLLPFLDDVAPLSGFGSANPAAFVSGSRNDGQALSAPYPVGTTIITWTATDHASNSSSCTQTITVLDAEVPTITCPSNIVQATDAGLCSAVVTWARPGVSDNCPGVTVACSPMRGSAFSKGVTPVTCTATDAVGNTARCSFTVTVEDRENPVIICPASIVVGNDPGQCSAVIASFGVSATDNCPGVTYACDPPAGSVFPKGSTVVTCTATDASANTAQCRFAVVVEDREAPRVACRAGVNPSGKKVPTAGKNPNSGENPDGYYQLLAKDNCDANPKCYIKDSRSSFVAGPFQSGDVVKITQAPGNANPRQKDAPQGIAAHLILRGDAMLYAVDADGNVSAALNCFVPPAPK